MQNIKLLTLAVILASLLLTSCNQNNTEGEWEQLFNGKDLSGWMPKIAGYEAGDNFGNTFRVEDGIIKVRYEEYDPLRGHFGHLFYNGEFSHYKLRVEYRFIGNQTPGAPSWAYRSSGIMVHGQTPESMDLYQDFPTSIEAQLLGSDSRVERTNMNVCTPGTNIVMNGELVLDHCINAESDYFFGDEWVTAKLIELNNGDKMLSKGTISLQSEGHPVDFRKIEILELK